MPPNTPRCFQVLEKSDQLRVVAENMARPVRGTGFARHTKTFMERGFPRNKLKAPCQDGEGFGEWFETPSYGKKGLGVDERLAGGTLHKHFG